MSLDNAKILVTGGIGQIGIAILQRMQSHHPIAQLFVLDLSVPAFTDPRYLSGVQYHAGSITDRELVRKLIQDIKPDVVFHTAGLIPQIAARLGKNTLKDFLEVNLEGTRIVVEESKRLGSGDAHGEDEGGRWGGVPGVKAFVLTSSADVVKGTSWLDLDGVTEETPVPANFDGWYAESKAKAEALVLSASESWFPTTALRTHGVFSANDSNIIPLFLAAPRNIQLGPGTNLYDFTFAPNLADAHLLAATNLLSITPRSAENEKSAAGKALFVTNAEPVMFKEFVGWIWDSYEGPMKGKAKVIPLGVAKAGVWLGEKVAGKKTPLTVKELGDSVSKRWFSNEKAKRVLGYKPEVGLKDGVRLAVEGYKVAKAKEDAGKEVPGKEDTVIPA